MDSAIVASSYPQWSASPVCASWPLTMDTIRRATKAIFESPRDPISYVVLPPPVRGTSQRDRRRRTVADTSGVRIELPDGSIPALFLMLRFGGQSLDRAIEMASDRKAVSGDAGPRLDGIEIKVEPDRG